MIITGNLAQARLPQSDAIVLSQCPALAGHLASSKCRLMVTPQVCVGSASRIMPNGTTIRGMHWTVKMALDLDSQRPVSGSSGRGATLALAIALAACGTPQVPGGGAASPAAAASSPATRAARAGPVTPVVEAPPPAPVVSLTPQEVQRAISSALDSLQEGQEDQAEAELARVLQSDSNNRLAQGLMRQIKDDPVTSLGRESFAYRVQPGESLSRIAQRFMNDLHLFYILARYNNIKVPRNLAGGQVIRIPGKAPSANQPAAQPVPAAVATPSAPPPVAVPAPAAVPVESESAAASRLARQRSEAVARHSRAARAAFAKQDLDAAIQSWNAVLEIEPDNRTAQLEKQKVLGLKEKLRKVK